MKYNFIVECFYQRNISSTKVIFLITKKNRICPKSRHKLIIGMKSFLLINICFDELIASQYVFIISDKTIIS